MNKSQKKSQLSKHRISNIFIISGLALIFITVSIKLYSTYEKNKLIKNYEAFQSISYESNSNTVSNDDINFSGEDISDSNKSENILGIINIPKIDLKAPIGKGTDKETLKYSVGHFDKTSMPGEIGNCCIIGHRSYTYGEFFNRLDEINIDDVIVIDRNSNKYTYKVIEKFVVNPEDTYVLDDSKDYQLTLITCTPIRVGTHRLIIRAILEN